MKRARGIGLGFAALALFTTPGLGPTDPTPRAADRSALLSKLSQRVTVQFSDRRLADVVTLIEQATGLRLEPLYPDRRHDEGLDPDVMISVSVENAPIRTLLEQVIERADTGAGGGATWQVSRAGAIQIGPRSRLNAFKRIEVYDVRDLTHLVPDHRRGPTIDLNQALRGDGIPISGADLGNEWPEEAPPQRERAEVLAELIRDLVEPDQWIERGGEGGSIRIHERMLIISAPGYIHRAIGR